MEHHRSLATECHPCKKAAACSAAHAGCRDPGARSQRGKSQPQGGFPRGKGAAGGKPLSRAGREEQEKGLPGGTQRAPGFICCRLCFQSKRWQPKPRRLYKGAVLAKGQVTGQAQQGHRSQEQQAGAGAFPAAPTSAWPYRLLATTTGAPCPRPCVPGAHGSARHGQGTQGAGTVLKARGRQGLGLPPGPCWGLYQQPRGSASHRPALSRPHSSALTWFSFFPQPYRAPVCALCFSRAAKQPGELCKAS